MNDIERKLQTFLKVLYKSYPQLINNFKHSIKFEDIMYPGSNFRLNLGIRYYVSPAFVTSNLVTNMWMVISIFFIQAKNSVKMGELNNVVFINNEIHYQRK